MVKSKRRMGRMEKPERPGNPARSRTARALGLPEIADKIMDRSYMRSGTVAEGTLLSSRARQITVSFPPSMVRKLQLAAEDNHISVSEMIRQCVQHTFE